MASFNVNASNGLVFFRGYDMLPYPPDTGGIVGGGGYDSPGGGGGICGSGEIWSSEEQIVWVSAGGVRYPMLLKPGINRVWFWIPSIYPEDTWTSSSLVFESSGYILIPAGFEWNTFTGVGAPPEPMVVRMGDSVVIGDSWFISFRKPDPGSGDLYITDSVDIEDNVKIIFKQGGSIRIIAEDSVDIHESSGVFYPPPEEHQNGAADAVNIADSVFITFKREDTPTSGNPGITDAVNIADNIEIKIRQGGYLRIIAEDTVDIEEDIQGLKE